MFPNSSKKLHNPSTQRTEPAIFSCSRSFWFNRDWGPKVPNPRKHNSQTQRQQRNWIPRFKKARFFPLKQRNPDEGSRNSTIRARGRGRRRWKNSLAPAPVNTGKREVTAARGSIYIYTRRARACKGYTWGVLLREKDGGMDMNMGRGGSVFVSSNGKGTARCHW